MSTEPLSTAVPRDAGRSSVRRFRATLKAWQKSRRVLWVLLVVLVVALLGLLVWLAGRYEASLRQSRLEADAAATVVDIRNGLSRNARNLQALQVGEHKPDIWHGHAAELLRRQREMVRIEWRANTMALESTEESPYRASAFAKLSREDGEPDVALTCNTALRMGEQAYSSSYFVPQPDGLGLELLDICLPVSTGGQLIGFTVATYALQDVLAELVGKDVARGQGLSFTEADGTRLAIYGAPGRGNRAYVAQQLLDLPGNTLVLRMESRQGVPDFFPNVLTALVSAMALALLAVLLLLGRDMRRRVKVENDLAEALAFRKAMEDSLVTGLRARDLEGRITYVNPAFCQMVGVDAKELLDHSLPTPYWPPELAGVYQHRQAIRMATNPLPSGGHESVFMRRDGTRFPVLIIEAPLINAAGKHTGWMSAILDISEQRRVEEVSRASQDRLQATARLAMVGEMASLLSHELNQPLAAISSYATGSLNLLQGRHMPTAAPLDGDLQLALRRITEQAERAGKVIKSVHDFVRRRDQAREGVKPMALFDAIMPLVTLQARKLSVRVAIEVDPACPAVLCDRTMVEQVLLNLSRNGMQAMQQQNAERLLTLRVQRAASREDNRWVEFSVVDTGEGIAEAVAEQLFTPFFTTKEEGMGLGLSLCRTVVEQHGGFLGFEPQLPRGTVFKFTLPAVPVAVDALALSSPLVSSEGLS